MGRRDVRMALEGRKTRRSNEMESEEERERKRKIVTPSATVKKKLGLEITL